MAAKPDYNEAFEEHVWEVHGFFAYRLGTRSDAEDLTQETFERAFRAWTRYDPTRASVRTWLLAIARNLLIDHYRAGSIRKEVELPENLDIEAPEEPMSLGIDPGLAGALAGLADRDREIIALRFGGDLSGPEIAALTGASLANVQQILSRSLRRMRVALEEAGASVGAVEVAASEEGGAASSEGAGSEGASGVEG